MDHYRTWRFVTPLVAALAISLGGCLNEEEPASDDGSDNPPSVNRAPAIAGSPQDFIMTGDIYVFQPTASDPERDRLTFTIENKPRWATFSSATGELRGQPLLGDEGVYDQIVISVNDASNTTSLPAFSITVTEASLGSMTLSWVAPSENTDGTALTDLAGFRLYYGRSEGFFSHRIDIDNPGISTYVVENLFPDTYYVVATAVNTAGIESDYSNISVILVEGT